MQLVLLEVLPEALHLLRDREAALREMRVEVLQESEQDRVVPHPLAAIDHVPVHGPVRLRGVLPEVEAEPLRGVGLPRADGAVQEGVARGPRLHDGPEEAKEPLGLLLPVDQLVGEVVERQLPGVLEHGRTGAERHG